MATSSETPTKLNLRTSDEPLLKGASGYSMTGIDVAPDANIEALFLILRDMLEVPSAKERLTDSVVAFIHQSNKVAASLEKNNGTKKPK